MIGKEINGSIELIAYVIAKDTVADIDKESLRNYLKESLPDYMIPSRWMELEDFPLTASGKLDRKALPEPDGSALSSGTYEEASTDMEHLLVSVWQEALGIERVGVNDNFFLIGGDSIKSIRIISHLQKQGYSLAVQDIFTRPTIRELAPYVVEKQDIADQSMVEGLVPLTPIQHWFFERIDFTSHYNQSVLLKSSASLDMTLLTESMKMLQEHHLQFHQFFQMDMMPFI